MIPAENAWRPPPGELTLSHQDVHVWRAFLDREFPHLQDLRRSLSPDEIERAERYHFQEDRERFIVAHGLLRTILARYLRADPGRLVFSRGDYGKPVLASPPGGRKLSFNLSHSSGIALYAIAHDRRVGIDLERVREDIACQQIAERFFSPAEAAVLRTLPASSQPGAFFACWTRKEAYIKARGRGLQLPLDRFEVSLAPGEPARLLKMEGEPGEVARWSLQELIPAPGYAAALAAEGQDWHLACWTWTR